jgi:predicted Zn-dependent peptidase
MPVVTFLVQVRAGSGSDPNGQEGLAGLTADMLDEGTGSLSAIGVSDALAHLGAEFDIDVGPDATTITLTTLTRFAERGVALLADLVVRPSLREEDFERLRQLRLNRLAQLRDAPGAVAERAFLRLLYGDHSYGHLAIGSDRTLRALTLDGLQRFHAAGYQPELATVVIGGDLAHEELQSLAERAFGGWETAPVGANGHVGPAGGGPAAADIEPARVAPVRLAIVPREGAAQSQLRIGHLAARRSTPDYPALLVMNSVLGGQFVSRVNLKLREEKGYTYGARTGFDWRLGLSPFSLDASVDTKATADAILDSLAELSAIRADRPPTMDEMVLARATLTRGYPRNFETVQQVARSAAQLVLYDLPDTYFEDFVPRVNAVTAGDVTRVARTYLDPSRMSTLVVGDHEAIGESLGRLNLGDPLVLSPES